MCTVCVCTVACEMKSFGVKVVLVKPGIIDTAMAHRIMGAESTQYPHAARISSLFATTLTNAPVPPTFVGPTVPTVTTPKIPSP